MSRWARRALAVGACGLLVAGAAFFALRTGMVARLLREQIVQHLRASFADVRLDRVELTANGTIVLRGLRVGAADAEATLRLPVVRLSLAPVALLGGRLVLSRVVVGAPSVRVVRSGGRWTLAGFRGGSPGSHAAPPVEIGSLLVHGGRVVIALDNGPPRKVILADLRATVSGSASAARQTLHIEALELTPRGVDVSPLRVSGTVSRRAGGSVCVDDLQIVSERSQLVSTGCVDPAGRVDARFAVEPLDPGELRALLPASPISSAVSATLETHGPWRSPAIRLRADLGAAGALRGRGTIVLGGGRPAWRGHAQFARLDPQALAGALPWGDVLAPLGLASSGPTRLSGRGAFRGAGWGGQMRLGGRVALGPSVIRGWSLEAARVRGLHEPRRTRLKARVATEAGRAAVNVVHDGEAGYTARARVELEQTQRLIAAATGRASARIAVQGSGADWRTAPASVQASVRGLSLRGVPIGVGRATARVENGTVRVEDATVRGPGLTAKATGSVDLGTRRFDATGQVRLALTALAPAAGAPPLRGDVSVQAGARGRLGDIDVRAQLEAKGVAGRARDLAGYFGGYLASHPAGGLAVDLGALQLTFEASQLGGEAAALSVAAQAADIGIGSLARRSARVDADWQRRARASDRAHLVVSAGSEEEVTERLRAEVRRRAGGTEIDVAELLLTPAPDLPIRLLRPARGMVAGHQVRIAALEFGVASDAPRDLARGARGASRVWLDGRFGLRGANAGTVTVEGLELGPVCRASGLLECGGRVAGRLEFRGTAAVPKIEGNLAADTLVLDGVEYGSLDVAIDYVAPTLRMAGALRVPATGAVNFDARVPVDFSWEGPGRDTRPLPLLVVVRSDALDLRLLGALGNPDIRDAGGQAMVDLRLTGTRAAPQIAGRAELARGWLTPAAAGTTYGDLEATVIAEGEHLNMVALRARSGEGRLEGSGSLRIADAGRGGELALDLRLEDFLAVRRRTLEVAAGGALQLRGRLDAPELTGTLDLGRLILRPVAIEALSTAPLPEPDSTIEVVLPPGSVMPASGREAGPRFGPLAVVLDVRLARDAWIRSPEANIELGGELHIEKAPHAAPRVTGEIVLLRGWYAFQGRRFTVRQGTITLPEDGGDPQLDVTGIYRVRGTGFAQGHDVFVTVRGPSSAPELALSSEPPLEQGDVLSVLLFGKPMDDLTAGQATGLQEQTVRLAGQYAIGELGASVRDGLGLHTLDVELPEGQQGTGRVTVGRYVTRDVLVSLGHEFGSSVAEVFGVEYGITRSISVRGSTSTDGRSAVDLFWRRRY